MILLQFQVGELAEFLKYGISGLSAIAFILSFFLLNRESARPKPRPEMLRSIRMFMVVTLILGIVSGVAAILDANPKPAKNTTTRKTTTSPKKAPSSLTNAMGQTWQIEIFYDPAAQPLARQLAEELDSYKGYSLKLTPLASKRKKELKITANQIRHESSELSAATQLQKRVSSALPQDVKISLKQITSSSPDYISIFVLD